jgi:hypothetical protein
MGALDAVSNTFTRDGWTCAGGAPNETVGSMSHHYLMKLPFKGVVPECDWWIEFPPYDSGNSQTLIKAVGKWTESKPTKRDLDFHSNKDDDSNMGFSNR